MITALDEKTALVLIDLQNGIAGMPLAHPVKDVLANAAKLLDAFHVAKLPVIIVNVNPAGGAWTKSRKEPSTMPASQFKEDWLDIVPELKKLGVTGIVLGGISTSIGVEGTARGASARGYNITFATDAMTDMFADAHAHSLKYIFPRVGELDTTGNILKFL